MNACETTSSSCSENITRKYKANKMTSTHALLHCLHLGLGKSWLDKEFRHRYLAGEEVREIYVNYSTQELLEEAVGALSKSFAYTTLGSGALAVGSYRLTLRVKPWLHMSDFDLVDYDSVKSIFFNKWTQRPLSEEERKRFVAKRCFLHDAIYQMFMRGGEQEESVREQISSSLTNGWIFYEQNTGEALEFLPEVGSILDETTHWKCRHYRPETIRFSIGDHEYETTVAHPIDSFALFEQMKSLVLHATQ